MTLVARSMALLRRVSTPATPRQGELLSVQALRGFAVLLVFVVHVEDMANRFDEFANFRSFYTKRIGYSAADLFYVVSGFIIAHITLGNAFKAKSWFIGRFSRIYPMYFIFTFLALLIFLAKGDGTVMGSGPHAAWTIFKSFLILPQGQLPLLFVGWTLEHEVVFYAIVFFTCLLMEPRRLVWVMVGLSLLALAKWIAVHRFGVASLNTPTPSIYLWQFLMGVLIYHWRDPLRTLGTWPAGALSLAFLIAGVVIADSEPIGQETPLRVLVFGATYSFLLIACLNNEDRMRASFDFDASRRSLLVRIGDASYSMYLFHPFLLAFLGYAGRWLKLSGLAAYLWLPLSYVAIIVCGLVLYATVEQRVISGTRRLMVRWLG